MAEYKKLFNVVIHHTFYTSEVSRDFDIVPTRDTLSFLKNNRLLFRKDDTGFRVLYQSETNSALPFIPFGGFDLKFEMELKNKNGFQNFTDLTETIPGPDKEFVSGNLVYFSNANQTGNNLKYAIIDLLKPVSFTYNFPQPGTVSTDVGQLVITNEASVDVTPTYPDPDTIQADSNGKISYPIDFTSMPAGLYTFATTVNNITPMVQKIYIDSSLIRNSIFGLIKIKVVDSATFPGNRQYGAEFVKRETKWRYKIVLKTIAYNPGDEDDYAVVDGLGEFVFTDPTVEFTNGLPTLVSESTTKIPWNQTPRKDFNFVKDPDTTPIEILGDLSNPPNNLVSANGNNFNKSVIYITV